uniref:Dynein regulatory complex protein 1 n=2 Tax=Scylla olivacea TaxID=85551 RepID=A0A0P4W235_SCYOL
MMKGSSQVGNVEVAALSWEVRARVESEGRREEWRTRLEEDSRKTHDALHRIQQYWEEVVGLSVPEDLHQGLCQLQDWTQELTDQKIQIVTGLRDELGTLDAAYESELQQQARQRRELLRRITEHVSELHHTYRDALRAVQAVADKERAALVQHYGNMWDQAVAGLDEQLQRLLHERLHNRTSRLDQIIELKLHGAAEHMAAMDKLDTDIEKVLVEVMRMKAAQQVEESQLRYSQQVLQQQYRETTALVSEARRSLNALTPILNTYRRKSEAADAGRAAREQAAVREAARLRQVSQQHRGRLAHISALFTRQARSLSLMHYRALRSHVMQVLEVERAIQQGVLARDWVEPDLQPLDDLSPAPNPRHTSALAAATRILRPPTAKPARDTTTEDLRGALVVMGEEHVLEEGEEDGDSRGPSVGDEGQEELYRLREVFLTRLAREAVFLLNTDAAHLAEHDPLLTLEHVFWELSIHTEADVAKLLRQAERYHAHRLPRPRRREHDDTAEDEGADGKDDNYWIESESEELFTPEDVLSILVTFCTARNSNVGMKAKTGDEMGPDHMYAQEGDEAARWRIFVDNLYKRTRLWATIKDALTQYRDVLTGRLEESQRVERLRRENAELRFLLQSVAADIQ